MFSTIGSKKSALPSINFLSSFGECNDVVAFQLKYSGFSVEKHRDYSDYKQQLDNLVQKHHIEHAAWAHGAGTILCLYTSHTEIKNQSEKYKILKAFILEFSPGTEGFFCEIEKSVSPRGFPLSRE